LTLEGITRRFDNFQFVECRTESDSLPLDRGELEWGLSSPGWLSTIEIHIGLIERRLYSLVVAVYFSNSIDPA
jgi:hypothetical protein